MGKVNIEDIEELEEIFLTNFDIVKGVTQISVKYVEGSVTSEIAMNEIIKLIVKKELKIGS